MSELRDLPLSRWLPEPGPRTRQGRISLRAAQAPSLLVPVPMTWQVVEGGLLAMWTVDTQQEAARGRFIKTPNFDTLQSVICHVGIFLQPINRLPVFP